MNVKYSKLISLLWLRWLICTKTKNMKRGKQIIFITNETVAQ